MRRYCIFALNFLDTPTTWSISNMSSSDESDDTSHVGQRKFNNVWKYLNDNCPDLASINLTKKDVAKYSVLNTAVQTTTARDQRERKEKRLRMKEDIRIKQHLEELSAFGVPGHGMILFHVHECKRTSTSHSLLSAYYTSQSTDSNDPTSYLTFSTEQEKSTKEKYYKQVPANHPMSHGVRRKSTDVKTPQQVPPIAMAESPIPAATTSKQKTPRSCLQPTKSKTKGKAIPSDALFAKNIASQGGYYDEYALRFPAFYPDGTQEIDVCKVAGKENETPTVAWAHITNNRWSRCFGVFQCPHFGESTTMDEEGTAAAQSQQCWTRERPRIPRRGGNKSNDVVVDKSESISIIFNAAFE